MARGAIEELDAVANRFLPDLPFALALEQFLIRDLSPRCNDLGKRKVGPK
jgi:hypothetical protein